MSHLLLKCKDCIVIADTGVSMDFESFCTSEFETKTVVCRSHTCGRKMYWIKRDVLVISFCKFNIY